MQDTSYKLTLKVERNQQAFKLTKMKQKQRREPRQDLKVHLFSRSMPPQHHFPPTKKKENHSNLRRQKVCLILQHSKIDLDINIAGVY